MLMSRQVAQMIMLGCTDLSLGVAGGRHAHGPVTTDRDVPCC